MINFYGVFQLVKVHKEDKTKKGDTVIYFTAATKRTEADTDFKFFKMYGNDADFFLRNLIRDSNGHYKSRKMFIHGYVSTYYDNEEVKCTASLTPEHIPQQLGYINKNIKINAKTTTKVQKDIYMVRNFEFVDSKGDNDIEVIVSDDMTEYTNETVISSDNNNASPSTDKETRKQNKSVQDTIGEAFKDLDNIKTVGDIN